jgi:hypothetical protein
MAFQHMANMQPDAKGKWIRAIATLYDGHVACIFGSQCMSAPVKYANLGVAAEHMLSLDFDIFWHTQNSTSDISMLIQLTMSSRNELGALVNEYCIGWARVPIVEVFLPQHLARS